MLQGGQGIFCPMAWAGNSMCCLQQKQAIFRRSGSRRVIIAWQRAHECLCARFVWRSGYESPVTANSSTSAIPITPLHAIVTSRSICHLFVIFMAHLHPPQPSAHWPSQRWPQTFKRYKVSDGRNNRMTR